MARRRLGQILIDQGLIDEAQLRSALGHQNSWGGRLGDALVKKGFLTEAAIVEALGRELDLPVVDLAAFTPDAIALDKVGVGVCEAHDALPLRLESAGPRCLLTCALADPQDLRALEALEFRSGCRIRAVLATPSSIRRAIARWYRGETVAPAEARLQVDTPEGDDETGEMVLIRPGGVEDRVRTASAPSAEAPPTAAPSAAEWRRRVAEQGRLRRMEADVAYLLGEGPEPLPKGAGPVLGLARLLLERGLVTREDLAAALRPSAPDAAA